MAALRRNSPPVSSFTSKEVHGKQILLRSDSTDAMAVPSWIKAVPNGGFAYTLERNPQTGLQEVKKYQIMME